MTPLEIEPLKPVHADLLFAAYQDPRLYQYIPGQPPSSLDALRKEYSEFEAGAPADSHEVWLNWVIKRCADQQCVGTLQATLMADGKLWIGYVIAPTYWGQGFASAAIQLMLAELRARFANRGNDQAAVETCQVCHATAVFDPNGSGAPGRSGFVVANREVLAAVDIRNIASIKVVERNGFTRVRKEAAEIRGEQTEDYIYSLQL